jgi:diaminohydroxyphosphoribosylaminopyrimidine deaminase / 5-amino-6-(5-phosphoribosylamino)uracil reductase
VPDGARVWAPGARRFLLTTAQCQAPEGVEVLTVPPDHAGRVSLDAALRALGGREVNEVLIECGPYLAGAFLQSGLVDEIVVYLAPSLLGHDAQPLAHLPGLVRLDQRLRLTPRDVRLVGEDIRVTAVVAAAPEEKH